MFFHIALPLDHALSGLLMHHASSFMPEGSVSLRSRNRTLTHGEPTSVSTFARAFRVQIHFLPATYKPGQTLSALSHFNIKGTLPAFQ